MNLVIKSPQIADRACEIIRACLKKDVLMEVVIREHKESRSAAQNRLMWQWATVIAAELGESKDEIHKRNKERFLVPIFERDDAEYAEMIESVRAVWKKGMIKEANAMKKQIVSLTSTTKCNVKQFTEFLNEIERDAASLGIILPHPEDTYEIAMRRAA